LVSNKIRVITTGGRSALPNLSYINSEKDLVHMRNLVTRFANDEQGAALVEYGMLVGLIAVVCIAAVTALGVRVEAVFTTITADLAAA
jgi:pilus assembly protein Flp/PilA